MPELPEVEFGRLQLEREIVGRTISAARCADDRIVFEGCTPRRCASVLRGARVRAACRRGKQLWLALDRGPAVLLHFGMTGRFVVPGEAALDLASTPTPGTEEWPPRFWKLHLQTEDGRRIAMTNARRLGRIRLRDDPTGTAPISNLGFDPLLDPPTPTEFSAMLDGRRGNIKGKLLDQSFIAGVGNWIADEVLFAAKLSPHRTAESLSLQDARRLHRALKGIIGRAVAVNADATKFPRTWLFHRRWGHQRGGRTSAGDLIRIETVAGRSTAWAPAVQR